MTHNFTRKKLAYLIGVSLAFPTYSSFAQDDVEEIIVTAQKREQEILDVPMAISAVTAAEIERMGATDLGQIQSTIPSLHLQASTSGNMDTAIIRSIAVDSTAGLPVVGRYLDESNVNADRVGRGITIPMLDLARVEVLKGPQGTLYGEGSIGGTIRYITNSPSLDGSPDLTIEATGNSVDDGGDGYRFMVAGNLPINSDTFGVRLVYFNEVRPGWIDSIFWGDEANENERESYRLKALWAPTATFDINFMYQHYESEQLAGSRSEPDFINRGFTHRNIEEDYDLYQSTLNWDITDTITMTSSTSWQDRTANTPSDVSGFVLPIEAAFFPGTTVFAPLFNHDFIVPPEDAISQIGFSFPSTTESFNHETRFSGTYGDDLFWTAGIFYKDQDFSTDAFSVWYPVADVIDGVGHEVEGVFSTEALSFFGDVNYVINDQWEVNFGARRYSDDRSSDVVGSTFG
ncbi:MAG: TonB-dependent receptor plug domain-containing protein, partial [Gammaproteobacteria bacterium]|nr:TonB-dependent receptor plug domain-containing protein [Gammaproteobacteria bacterium]